MTTSDNHTNSWRARALVLGGGGARGALQAGAVRALVEPDLLVGTSIGAVNATHLALHGWSPAGLDALEATWRDAAAAGMLRSRLETVLRRLFGGSGWSVRAMFRQFHREMQLAAARDIPVHYVELSPGSPLAVYEFPRAVSLIQVGYERMRAYLRARPELAPDHAPPVPARREAAA